MFETDGGAVRRHHFVDRLLSLLAGFADVETRHIAVTTMNGREVAGIQIPARSQIG
ncbi:hypothetical protein ABZT03_07040 [Streptomyces sp. NPDC005574]|uniref:hypothetical protein n=1 Tax=Streptomyces sp. NPDC005574 TaxID=3156891 RepID=UPI0033B88886